MMADEDINNKIFHAEGPQGQRVVIVPPGTNAEIQGSASEKCCYCCFGCTISAAIVCLLLGTYYLAIAIYQFTNSYGQLNYLCFIILGTAVLLVVVSIHFWRRAGRAKAKAVLQYMHKDVPGERRTQEELDEEEIGMRYEMRAAAPDALQSRYHTSYDTPPLQPLIPTGPSPGITDQLPSS